MIYKHPKFKKKKKILDEIKRRLADTAIGPKNNYRSIKTLEEKEKNKKTLEKAIKLTKYTHKLKWEIKFDWQLKVHGPKALLNWALAHRKLMRRHCECQTCGYCKRINWRRAINDSKLERLRELVEGETFETKITKENIFFVELASRTARAPGRAFRNLNSKK